MAGDPDPSEAVLENRTGTGGVYGVVPCVPVECHLPLRYGPLPLSGGLVLSDAVPPYEACGPSDYPNALSHSEYPSHRSDDGYSHDSSLSLPIVEVAYYAVVCTC